MNKINNCFKNLEDLQRMLGMAYDESFTVAMEKASKAEKQLAEQNVSNNYDEAYWKVIKQNIEAMENNHINFKKGKPA